MTHLVLGPRKGHLYKQSRKKNFNCVIIFYSFDNLLKIVFCCVISGDAGRGGEGVYFPVLLLLYFPSFLFFTSCSICKSNLIFYETLFFFLLLLFCFGEKKCGIRLIFCEMLSFHLMCNSVKWELTTYLLKKKTIRFFFYFILCLLLLRSDFETELLILLFIGWIKMKRSFKLNEIDVLMRRLV